VEGLACVVALGYTSEGAVYNFLVGPTAEGVAEAAEVGAAFLSTPELSKGSLCAPLCKLLWSKELV
jgi:hypothetical protein